MSASEEQPVYDWERARIGDAASSVEMLVPEHKIRGYVRAQRDPNPAYGEDVAAAELKVPLVLVRIYAPLRRRELVAEMGAVYPNHPTPAVRWRSRFFTAPRVGDSIVSVTRIHDKYIRKGRHFLEWKVEAKRSDGERIAEFTYVNLWDRGRPEDRNR